MLLFRKNKRSSFLKNLVPKKRPFLRSSDFCSKNALHFLNVSQFLGVVNDNLFKYLTLFLLIDIKGVEASSSILFWVGTIYVLPFLFFSSAAGVLADKFSKQKIIVALKGIEVFTTGVAILAFWLQSAWACYAVLFLLAFHSAVFGPPKYSIIPEIVHDDKISKANGLITSFMYLGVIAGGLLASFTTQITSKNFPLCALVGLGIALLGFACSFLIPYTEPTRTSSKIKFFFLKEIYKTLEFCYRSPHLLAAILSAAFFLYLGAFFQLNIIPFAIQSLGLSAVGGGYLTPTVAIGIAIGAVIVGKLSKNEIVLGFSCLSGFILFFLVLSLAVLPKWLFLNVILLVLIGCFSGFFIVPIEAYIQKYSPDEKRGQFVATSNFMSFTGVLMAPFSIYLLSGSWGLSAAQGFSVVSVVVLFVSLFLSLKLSNIFFYFIGRKIFPYFYKISSSVEIAKEHLYILKKPTLKKALFLSYASEDLHFFILKKSFHLSDLLLSAFSSVHVLYENNMRDSLLESLEEKTPQKAIPCLLVDPSVNWSEYPHKEELYRSTKAEIITVNKTRMHKTKEISIESVKE